MSSAYSETVETARDYYNSDDADNFYFEIWGGEDIHIGLYRDPDEDIPQASERTVRTLAERLETLGPQSRVVDLGAGYGGAARWLARNKGCSVACINLSEAQNARNREITEAAKLSDLIQVYDASFEDIPLPDDSFSIAWSQDSLLHSGNRGRVLEEIDRVLAPGGEVIFTDPMQADDCPPDVLGPILQRIHLSTLGSFEFYRGQAKKLGWEEVGIVDLSEQLTRHYTRVREQLLAERGALAELVSSQYIDRMTEGLGHWIEGGTKGYLAWGILHFRKPPA